MTIVKYLKDN